MGASFSIQSRIAFDEYIYSTRFIHNYGDDDESDDCNSPVWIAINTIINTILIIKKDLECVQNIMLIEVMKTIVMNMDSIYDIKYDSFNYGTIKLINNVKINTAKQILHDYYKGKCLVVIKLNSNQQVTDLGCFMYNIFNFKIVHNCLYVYVSL
jgi:hypothetical protein